MTQAFIIEDEPRARKYLMTLLETHFPEIRVVGTAGSVRESVDLLENHGKEADLIFMDVELSDGNCFEIFKRTEVRQAVIMTTAYDNYAVKAFEVNSVDYLLKPIDTEYLRRAVDRALERIRTERGGHDLSKIMDALTLLREGKTDPGASPKKEKFIIRLNDRIVPVNTREIAYFYSESKNSFLVTRGNVAYVIDESLDAVEHQLDPGSFFRISRSCIISSDAIESVSKLFGGRLKISLTKGIDSHTDLTVSRARVVPFMNWLEN